jgi:hypothetical protein
VKLHHFYIGEHRTSARRGGDAITGCRQGICGACKELADATCRQHHRPPVECVADPVTILKGDPADTSVSQDEITQVSEITNLNVGMVSCGTTHGTNNLRTGRIAPRMHNPIDRVRSFASECQPIVVAIECDADGGQKRDRIGSGVDDLAHNCLIAESGTGIDGVCDMADNRIVDAHRCSNPTLRVRATSIPDGGFGDDDDWDVLCGTHRDKEPCKTAPYDDQRIVVIRAGTTICVKLT